MGLDIVVRRPVMHETEEHELVSDEPHLREIFPKFVQTRVNEYYDEEKGLRDLGFTNPDALLWHGTQFGKDVVFRYANSEHPLYQTFLWLRDKWADSYFPTQEELFASEVFREFQEKHLEIMKEYHWTPEYLFYVSGREEWSNNLVPARNFVEDSVIVTLLNPPIMQKTEEVIYYDDIGYQRKGQNAKFGKDKIWDSPAIVSLDVLRKHWKKYFSASKEFKQCIVDKFVEGETYVMYT